MAFAFAKSISCCVSRNDSRAMISVVEMLVRSLKPHWSVCGLVTMMAPICSASIAAKVASSGSTSSRPRLRTSVWPIEKDSSVDISIVGDFDVVHDRGQNLVHFARRRNQARTLQALENVIFRLVLPLPLRLNRRGILVRRRLILNGARRFDSQFRKFRFARHAA